MAKIKLPFDRESIRRILIQTVSAAKCRKGSLRYWLSAGPGDFQLSPSGCHGSSLYAVVIQDDSASSHSGIKVVTSSVPIKPPQFAVMKSVNYLPNALSKMEAEEKGAYAAIWLDGDGYIAEGPNMNVAFVTKGKELVMPKFDKILRGCTARRVLVLAESLVEEGTLSGIRLGDVTVEEGKEADEMMLIGSGVLVRAVVQWDDQVIGDGKITSLYGMITCFFLVERLFLLINASKQLLRLTHITCLCMHFVDFRWKIIHKYAMLYEVQLGHNLVWPSLLAHWAGPKCQM